MKHLVVLALTILPSLALITASGCGKASNDTRIAEEANGIIKTWSPRFDELGRRAEGLVQRGIALGDSGAEAIPPSKLLGDTRNRLNELRGLIAQAPSQIDVALNNAQKLKTNDELVKLMNNIAVDLLNAHVELNANLDTVESWLAFAEARPRPEPVPETAPPADPPANSPGPPGAGGVPPPQP